MGAEAEVCEVWVGEGLGGGDPLVGVEGEHAFQEVRGLGVQVGEQAGDAAAPRVGEVGPQHRAVLGPVRL